MSRFHRFAVALPLVAGLVFAWSVNAQPPRDSAAPLPGPPGGAPERPAKVAGIPAFSLLGAEPVQNELKLTEEQKQKARDLITDFEKQSLAEVAALRALPPQQQQAARGQLQQASAKRMATLRTQLEGLLTPQQLTELQRIAFQMTVMGNQQILESLNLTDAQRKDLEQIRAQAQAKWWDLQRDLAKKTINVLTPEQHKSLQEMVVQTPDREP